MTDRIDEKQQYQKPLHSFKFATICSHFKEGTNQTMKYFQPQIIYDFIYVALMLDVSKKYIFISYDTKMCYKQAIIR